MKLYLAHVVRDMVTMQKREFKGQVSSLPLDLMKDYAKLLLEL